MDRLNLNQARIEELRIEIQEWPVYADKSTPLPGTALKLDDDVEWLGLFPMRVLWGYETPDYFFAYCPDIGDVYSYFEGTYITDRAPADPEETPMPVYPQQQQQRQEGKAKHDPKRALHDLLKRIPPEAQKRVHEIVKRKRPELLK